MNVPIRNVYWLLLYAWDHMGAGEETSLAAEEPRHLHDLFAQVLAETVGRLMVRGLDRGYLAVEETLPGVRGRIDIGAAVRRGLAGSGRAHCHFDELRHDVPHNRILKATLRSLLPLGLDEQVGARVRRLVRALSGVSDVRLSRGDFSRIQLHRNNRIYDFALRLCRLIHDNLIVDADTGAVRFRDFRADQRKMGALFEAFVYRFYCREQTRYRVSKPKVRWHRAQGSDAALAMLPEMCTDVVLRSPERRIIVETKFYAEPFAGRYGAKKIRSAHLYQLLTYLQHYAGVGTPGPPCEGMLLYPVVDRAFRHDYELDGRRLAVRSIDLNQPWPSIRRDLLALIDEDELFYHPRASMLFGDAKKSIEALVGEVKGL